MSVDNISIPISKSQKNWDKARERFADSCQPDVPAFKTNMSPKAWVRAEESETTQTSLDTGSQNQG